MRITWVDNQDGTCNSYLNFWMSIYHRSLQVIAKTVKVQHSSDKAIILGFCGIVFFSASGFLLQFSSIFLISPSCSYDQLRLLQNPHSACAPLQSCRITRRLQQAGTAPHDSWRFLIRADGTWKTRHTSCRGESNELANQSPAKAQLLGRELMRAPCRIHYGPLRLFNDTVFSICYTRILDAVGHSKEKPVQLVQHEPSKEHLKPMISIGTFCFQGVWTDESD